MLMMLQRDLLLCCYAILLKFERKTDATGSGRNGWLNGAVYGTKQLNAGSQYILETTIKSTRNSNIIATKTLRQKERPGVATRYIK